MGGYNLSIEVETAKEATRILNDTERSIGGLSSLFLQEATITRTDLGTYRIEARWTK